MKRVGAEVITSGDPEVVAGADRLVLPGVGSFDAGMDRLRETGLLPLLRRRVLDEGTAILGLCLGMQLLARRSEEGAGEGLGWVDAEVVRFRFDEGRERLKVPHMGWNRLRVRAAHPLFAGMGEETRFYFAHSYHLRLADDSLALADAEYGYPFVAAVARENVAGVQFHPEKSHGFGLRLFRNFAAWSPRGAA
jgi:glutamine amidotransferase